MFMHYVIFATFRPVTPVVAVNVVLLSSIGLKTITKTYMSGKKQQIHPIL